MRTIRQINQLLDSMEKAIMILQTGNNTQEVEKEITDAIQEVVCGITKEVFPEFRHHPYQLVVCGESTLYLEHIKEYVGKIRKLISYTNSVDFDFYRFIQFIQDCSYENLKRNMVDLLQYKRVSDPEGYQRFITYYNAFYYFWGGIHPENGDYQLFDNRIQELKENYQEYVWLYERLGDYRSKKTLTNILYHWFCHEQNYLREIKERAFKDYFDLDLLQCDSQEVFIDIGAYIGDSFKDYMSVFGTFKEYHCYEISDANIMRIKEETKEYPNVFIHKKAVGNFVGVKHFNATDIDAANNVNDFGEIPIESTTIDRDIDYPVTFLKMDIEGSEKEAILGCSEHIKKDHPKLALSVYHYHEDIWKIAKMITDMKCNQDYRYYLRFYGNAFPNEILLYAI